MSLSVYLYGQKKNHQCRCPICDNEHVYEEEETLFSANITHNLSEMADNAGIRFHLWFPEKIGITKAGQLIEPLQAGLDLMKSDPDRFKKFDAENGWGTYEQFIPWIEAYLEACRDWPEATVSASR